MTTSTHHFALTGGLFVSVVILVLSLIASVTGMGTVTLHLLTDLNPLYSSTVIGTVMGIIGGFIYGYILFYLFAFLRGLLG